MGSAARHFFEKFTGTKAESFIILAASGSERINFVATANGQKYIVTQNSNVRENGAFIYLSKIFNEQKLNTPKVFAVSDDKKIYVQEFVGHQTLSEIIAQNNELEIEDLVKKTLQNLYQLQINASDKVDYSKAFEYESYDRHPVLHDLFYFKNFLVDVLEIHYHKSTLLKEFDEIVEIISHLQPRGIMLRDFQARNIMVDDGGDVYFIDYQSAMQGPLMYDVVSFLFQAKANFSAEFRNKMLDIYFDLWEGHNIKTELKRSLAPLQLMRFLQVLGAYGFRGLVQKKSHFIASINTGIKNIVEFSGQWHGMSQFPELQDLISQLGSDTVGQKINSIITK